MKTIAMRTLFALLGAFGFCSVASAQLACAFDIGGKDYVVHYKNYWPSEIRAKIWTRVQGESNWNLMPHSKACNGGYCDPYVISPGRGVTYCVPYAQVKKKRQLKVEMSCDGVLLDKTTWKREVTLPSNSTFLDAAQYHIMPDDFVRSICCNPYPSVPPTAAGLPGTANLAKRVEEFCGPKPNS